MPTTRRPPRDTFDVLPANKLVNVRRRVNRIRNKHGFKITCPASRDLQMIADVLAAGRPYPMLEEEPEHCAVTMLAVLESLWKARARELKATAARDGGAA